MVAKKWRPSPSTSTCSQARLAAMKLSMSLGVGSAIGRCYRAGRKSGFGKTPFERLAQPPGRLGRERKPRQADARPGRVGVAPGERGLDGGDQRMRGDDGAQVGGLAHSGV